MTSKCDGHGDKCVHIHNHQAPKPPRQDGCASVLGLVFVIFMIFVWAKICSGI